MTKDPTPAYRSSFPFVFGSYKELSEIEYVGYNLEALLYDAVQGLAISRYLIFDYFRSGIKQGHPVPAPIPLFVAHELGRVLDGEIKQTELLRPLGGKKPSAGLSPAAKERLLLSPRPLHKSSGTERKRFYVQRERERRITAVATILRCFYKPHSPAVGKAWHAKLKRLYQNKHEFDKLKKLKPS